MLKIPAVQEKAVIFAEQRLSESLGSKVEIGSVNLKSPQTLVLGDVRLSDQQNKVLFSSGEVTVSIFMPDLLKKKITIGELSVKNTTALIYRKPGETDFNFSFLTGNKKQGNNPWKLDLHSVYLTNIKVSYLDSLKQKFFKGGLHNSQIVLSRFDTDSLKFQSQSALIDGLNAEFSQLSENKKEPSGNGKAKPWDVLVNYLSIKNSSLRYDVLNKPTVRNKIDWNHISARQINGSFNGIQLSENRFGGEISSLAFDEKSGFSLQNLNAQANASIPSIGFTVNYLKTSLSEINGKIKINIPDIQKIHKEIGKINGDLNIEESHLSFADLNLIAGIKSPDSRLLSTLNISGDISGSVADFYGKNLEVNNGSTESFSGNISIRNLPDFKQSTFNAKVNKLSAEFSKILDILKISPDKVNHYNPGIITYKGKLKGTPFRITTTGSLISNDGIIAHSFTTSFSEKYALLAAQGNAELINIELGKILKRKDAGKVYTSFNVAYDGQTWKLDKGRIKSAEYKGYTYHDIRYNLTYDQPVVIAEIYSADTNISGSLCADIKTGKTPEYSLEAAITHADFRKIKLVNKPLALAGTFSADGIGAQIDSINGKLNARHLKITTDTNSYLIDSLNLGLYNKNGFREIAFHAPFADVTAKGNFNITELPAAGKHLLSHYYSGIKDDEKIHLDDIEFDVAVKNTDILRELLLPDLRHSENILLKGNFTSSNHLLNVSLQVGKINYADKILNNLDVKIAGDKTLLKTTAKSSDIFLSEKLHFAAGEITGEMYRDSLNFRLRSRDSVLKSAISIEGTTLYFREKFFTTINSADLVLRNNTWKIHGRPQIIAGPGIFEIDNLRMTAAPEQDVVINSSGKKVNAEFNNVIIEQLILLTGLTYPLKGIASGNAFLMNESAGASWNGSFRVEKLEYDKFTYGTASLTFSKTAGNNILNAEALISEGKSEVRGNGEIVLEDNGKINVDLTASEFNTSKILPFIKNQIYALEGNVDLDARVTGTVKAPEINGQLKLKGKHLLGLVLTNTSYYLEDQSLYFDDNKIYLADVKITDRNGTPANLNGMVSLEKLTDPEFDLRLSGNNFLVMNSSEKTGLPFYGNLYSDFKVRISGSLSKPVIRLNALADKNSELYMELTDGSSAYEKPGFITFKQDSATIAAEKKKKKASENRISSVKISGSVEITKNTIVHLIVDPANGDMISAKGDGKIQFEFNSDSDLNLFGSYTISEGQYGFTFLDLVRRDFIIKEGSTVSWVGDIEQGYIDVKAYYVANADRMPLIQDQRESVSPQEITAASRKLPVNVLLNLQGPYMHPDITFGIEVPEDETQLAGGLVSQRIREMQDNPEELNKQVMGLIAFNQFMPYQGWGLQGGGSEALASQSVSQLLNSQLSKITNQINALDLEVNINPADQFRNQSVNVRASGQITDRLSVSVGGDFAGGSQASQGSVFLGDYIVYYTLNTRGSMRIKVFSRGQQNIYNENVTQISGLSVQYSRSFDSFGKKKEEDKPQ